MTEKSGKRPVRDFHESFSSAAGEVQPPSPRSTGLVFTVVALMIGLIFRHNMTVLVISGAVATVLLSLSFLAPHVLQPLNIVWFRFGMLLHKVVNPVVMFLMFAVAFVPMGLIMRLFYDPLRLKRPKGVDSYWTDADPAAIKLASMKTQF
jgi:hypothetical protein